MTARDNTAEMSLSPPARAVEGETPTMSTTRTKRDMHMDNTFFR